MAHTRRAQLLLHIFKQLLLYIPGMNSILRVAPKKGFIRLLLAVDTRIHTDLIVGRQEFLISHSSQRSLDAIYFHGILSYIRAYSRPRWLLQWRRRQGSNRPLRFRRQRGHTRKKYAQTLALSCREPMRQNTERAERVSEIRRRF